MSLFDLVSGCWHKRCTFPITVRGKLRRGTATASVTGTYVVCLGRQDGQAIEDWVAAEAQLRNIKGKGTAN